MRRRQRVNHTDKPFELESGLMETVDEAMARFRALVAQADFTRPVAPASQEQHASEALKAIIRKRDFNLRLPEDEGDIL